MAAVQGVAVATFVPGKRKDSLNLKDNKNYLYVNKFTNKHDENQYKVAGWRCVR